MKSRAASSTPWVRNERNIIAMASRNIIVTTSKALVTTSVALVTSSLIGPCLTTSNNKLVDFGRNSWYKLPSPQNDGVALSVIASDCEVNSLTKLCSNIDNACLFGGVVALPP